MMITHAKIRTDTAEPSPRFTRSMSWSLPRIDTVRCRLRPRLDGDRVEDPECVERAEQQRHQDRRLHQGQRERKSAGRRGAVHLRGLVQLVRHEREAGEQEQRHERRRLPDLGHDDHEEGAARSVSGAGSR